MTFKSKKRTKDFLRTISQNLEPEFVKKSFNVLVLAPHLNVFQPHTSYFLGGIPLKLIIRSLAAVCYCKINKLEH